MKIFTIISFILIAATCNNRSSAVTDNDSSTLPPVTINESQNIAGSWILIPVMPSDSAGGKLPVINFNIAAQKFTGNSGCNSMSGSFQLSGSELKFNEQIISTRMACPGYNEKIFMDNLLKVNRYEIQDSVLSLMYNTTPLSKWSRSADTTPVKTI